jgi:hypothetical protein
MAILCPECGRQYDVTLFSFGATVHCPCGAWVSAGNPHVAHADEIARGADRISNLILYSDLPELDIRIAIDRLRDRARELRPDRDWFFEAVYESRFRRLMEQWREEGVD